MFCPKCGKELPDGAKFCTSCGAKIEVSSTGPAGGNTGFAGGNGGFGGNGTSGWNGGSGTGGYQRQQNPYPGPERQYFQGTTQQPAKWQIGKILGLVGGVLLFISAFLPIASASMLGYSVSYTYFNYPDGEGVMPFIGVIFLVLGAVVTLLSFLEKKAGVIVLSAVSIIWSLIWAAALSSAVSSSSYGFGSVGAGPILAVIGAVVGLIGGILYKQAPRMRR